MSDTPVLAAIGLGGNLGDAPATLIAALAALRASAGIRVLAVSPLYRSIAIGPEGQPDYANAAALLDTTLAAHLLLDRLQAIEHEAGRVRQIRWGARTLDLDLLLFGEQIIRDERLIVPHPEMRSRNFVLRPLADIMPQGRLPEGDTISSLARQLGDSGLTRWPDARWPGA